MGERALVVIPTYNEAGNLASLVPQVLAQDPRLEILVVDDKSPDGTGHIADAEAAKEPRVHVLHREGSWASAQPISRAFGGRWSGATTTCSRWTRTSPTIR